mmetsp:Transcript_25986/g.56362  ORF Transcript_25986/g.56362 Transcript_25986/m.56362 type:complete len:108 (-) Transcript_25986:519-842(-)
MWVERGDAELLIMWRGEMGGALERGDAMLLIMWRGDIGGPVERGDAKLLLRRRGDTMEPAICGEADGSKLRGEINVEGWWGECSVDTEYSGWRGDMEVRRGESLEGT